MPNDTEQYPEEYQIVSQPIPMYFCRLPDDERVIDKMMVGVLVKGIDKIFLRGAWDVDTWEELKTHQFWNVPRPMHIRASVESPGIVLRCNVPIPARLLPESAWPRGEAWQAPRRPGPQDWAVIPLGNLVRYARRFEHGDDTLSEAMAVLTAALSGNVVEPYEQGLAL